MYSARAQTCLEEPKTPLLRLKKQFWNNLRVFQGAERAGMLNPCKYLLTDVGHAAPVHSPT